MKYILLIFSFVISSFSVCAQKADLIVFSFDRPLQLYALLESVNIYFKGVETITVIYRTSSDEFDYAYRCIHDSFPSVKFLKQGAQPRQDFKPLTMQALQNSPCEYVIFAVDDNIVKDHVNLSYCIDMLNQTNAYGFYLRLGFNTSFCYTMNQPQAIPEHSQIQDDIFSWQFKNGTCDWGYPHTVDLTLFKKDDIVPTLASLEFYSPNVLESYWSQKAESIMARTGLFFAESKVVNLPLNIVQQDWHNLNQQELLPAQQLELFFAGKKIDLSPLFKIANQSPHMEYCPTLVDRH